MGKFIIEGGYSLSGEVKVQGSKNAVLPLLAATVLNKGKTYFYNCPKILDVYNMLNILAGIGCMIEWEDDVLIIDSSVITTHIIPEKYVQMMRSSIILLGSVLSRLKNVKICFPGGCSIGTRPIDLHLKALKQMNVAIKDRHGFIECHTNKIIGNHVSLDYPSVGATENIMLTAVLSEGTTVINNAAKEPEILELQEFLNKMGAKVHGAGTDTISIQGVSELQSVEYRIMPDRIVAGSYMCAVASAGGEVLLKDVCKSHMNATISKMQEMGCVMKEYDKNILIQAPKKLQSIDLLRTQPYPGFPTDMQAQIMNCFVIADGTSIIAETIFESRYKHVAELVKMGADIITDGRIAVIKGVSRLNGAEVFAEDLRGGAALVLAGLGAEGETVVNHAHHILRGYENLDQDLGLLGAKIKYTSD
ncbi:UDP-N-acetylglucosamine 1-carboxyvinyltransferase [Vallitalea pronyensis]|uniref:UDP-N-acetylglucosamine 1-carboxyvinyltransferase n=1 Tax=Vallitalea pronyensis TaxID=1348613 RepID=A0A8J8MKY8_9FIRM|nr:UDP-N-acetylglucosamine 1-carboxyvinyltransferase [Vallitalea pronyensis]QUI23208.1 UDP-N-acetylglucosamine 1-carboxyvinyltransferase [Vallitalea pronyensis]